MQKTFKESSRGGALIWLWQRITAVVLFVLLMAHFVMYHFLSSGAYSYDKVVAKMQSPWFNLMQFAFLITALYHGLNGVWMVAEDYIHKKCWRLTLLAILMITGVALLFVGVLTIFKISAMEIGG